MTHLTQRKERARRKTERVGVEENRRRGSLSLSSVSMHRQTREREVLKHSAKLHKR